jgi:hypothetical protein
MNRLFYFLFPLLFPLISPAGNKGDLEIIKTVIGETIKQGETQLYFSCSRPKTFFRLSEFKERASINVPDSVLKELEHAAGFSIPSNWTPGVLDSLNLPKDRIASPRCLTDTDVEELFARTKQNQNVLKISQPVYDLCKENCIVSLTWWHFTGSASGITYFLKKVYGKWTIIDEFDFWMT